MAQDMQMWANILLLVGGIVHAVPPLYSWLNTFTGGIAWIQIIVGVISVILARLLVFRK